MKDILKPIPSLSHWFKVLMARGKKLIVEESEDEETQTESSSEEEVVISAKGKRKMGAARAKRGQTSASSPPPRQGAGAARNSGQGRKQPAHGPSPSPSPRSSFKRAAQRGPPPRTHDSDGELDDVTVSPPRDAPILKNLVLHEAEYIRTVGAQRKITDPKKGKLGDLKKFAIKNNISVNNDLVGSKVP